MTPMIEILKPGLQTTVQDLGRNGQLAMAMPPSGAMDQFSHRLANALVANPAEHATLEIAMIGPSLTTHRDTVVAVTGAQVDLFIDDEAQPGWTALALRAGQTLRVGTMRAGTRVYLAVAGGIDVPQVMESRATYLTAAIGGLEGRSLRTGDHLPLGDPDASIGPTGQVGSSLPEPLRPRLEAYVEVRIVLGLAGYRFTPESLAAFTERDYAISPESNRTGYRLLGEALEFVNRPQPFGAGDNQSNVVSLGYPLGSIQVPNGKEPICLLRDAVTGGGFVTLGTVISADLDLLAQAKAPDRVRFTPVEVEDALKARRKRADQTTAAIAAIT